MDAFEKSQARGREALIRERAARDVAGGDRSPRTMRTLGIFSQPSFVGVGTAGDPATFDPVGKTRGIVLSEALRHSIAVPLTEKTHVRESADPTAPPWNGMTSGVARGESIATNTFFSYMPARHDEGAAVDELARDHQTTEHFAELTKRLSEQDPAVPSFCSGVSPSGFVAGAAVSGRTMR